MNMDAMNQLSYGIFVLTAHQNGRDNGSIINTAVQLTVEPNRIAITVNKDSLTHDMVLATRKFTISILSEQVDGALIQQFGFVSGKHVNKFAEFRYCKRVANGTMAITNGTNSYISAIVEQCIDLGSHTLFVALVTDATVWNSVPSATYAYYHKYIKKQFQEQARQLSQETATGTQNSGQPTEPAGAQNSGQPTEPAGAKNPGQPTEPAGAKNPGQPTEPAGMQNPGQSTAQARWICRVCGYIYDPASGDPSHGIPAGTPFERLPASWTCPRCGLGKDVFEQT